VTLETVILGYVAGLLVCILGIGGYAEQRRRRFGFTPSEDRIFRCGKCGFVYTDDPDVDRSRCPHCGTANQAITF
jgi:rubrerythrin